MRANSYIPDLVLCSSAKRARETLDWVARHIGNGRVIYSDSLYSTDAAGYVEFIRATANGDEVLLVGHNPMMEDVAMALSGDGDANARSALWRRIPDIGAGRHPLRGQACRKRRPARAISRHFITPADL